MDSIEICHPDHVPALPAVKLAIPWWPSFPRDLLTSPAIQDGQEFWTGFNTSRPIPVVAISFSSLYGDFRSAISVEIKRHERGVPHPGLDVPPEVVSPEPRAIQAVGVEIVSRGAAMPSRALERVDFLVRPLDDKFIFPIPIEIGDGEVLKLDVFG